MNNNERQTDGPEMERYATVKKWTDELGISHPTFVSRIPKEKGVYGKDRNGSLRRFFPESEVRNSMKDLLGDIPCVTEGNFFYLECDGKSERHGTMHAWAKEFGMAKVTVVKCMEGTAGITGKTSNGVIIEAGFYPESVIREKCSEFVVDCPRSDEKGMCVVNDERYATANVWEREFGIQAITIKTRLGDKKGITARGTHGKIIQDAYYSESDVRKALGRLLDTSLLRTDESGFAAVDGIRHGTIKAWSRTLNLHFNTIKKRLADVDAFDGKDEIGRVREKSFYPEPAVREKCADLLADARQASEEGFILVDNVRYATCNTWESILRVSGASLKKRLKADNCTAITGKDAGGHVLPHAFYAEPDVVRLMALVRPYGQNGK